MNLTEKFLLLAHHPSKRGYLVPAMNINLGIMGSFFMEMAQQGHIIIEDDFVTVKSLPDFSIGIELLQKIQQKKKLKPLYFWIARLSQKSQKLKQYYLNSLEQKHLIKIEHKKLLGLIPYQNTYIIDTNAQIQLSHQLQSCLSHFSGNEDDILLLGLIRSCELHGIFTRSWSEKRKLGKKMKTLFDQNPIAFAVNKALKQVQSAMIATTAAGA